MKKFTETRNRGDFRVNHGCVVAGCIMCFKVMLFFFSFFNLENCDQLFVWTMVQKYWF